MSRCPATELLQQLLADQLAGPQADALETHVEACPACQQALEQLTGSTGDRRGEASAAQEEAGTAFLRRLEREYPAARAGPNGAPHG